MKNTGIIGTIEFMGLSRPVRYEDASLTISNIGFAEAELVIKIVEGLKHGRGQEREFLAAAAAMQRSSPEQTDVSAADVVKAAPKPEPESAPKAAPKVKTPEPKAEPAPKKKRGRKKAPKKKEAPPPEPDPDQTDLEEYIDELDAEEPEPETEPDDVDEDSDDNPDAESDAEGEVDDDEDDVDVPVIKVTKELKACKTVRVIVEMLMNQGLDGAQTRAWMLENTDEIPALKRLGHRLPERLDRLATLIKVPGIASPE